MNARSKDESIKDTLIDLANYALICAILYDEANKDTIFEGKD